MEYIRHTFISNSSNNLDVNLTENDLFSYEKFSVLFSVSEFFNKTKTSQNPKKVGSMVFNRGF